MTAKQKIKLSDQIRKAIDSCGLSRYRICKEIGLDQPTLSRFMHGKSGLAVTTLDALADLLSLELKPTTKVGKGQVKHGDNR